MNTDSIDSNVTKLVILLLGWVSGHYLPPDVGASLATYAPSIAAGIGALAAFAYGIYKAHDMKKVPVISTALVLPTPAPPVGSTIDLTPMKGMAKVVGALLIGFLVLHSPSAFAQTNFQKFNKNLPIPLPIPKPAAAAATAEPTPAQVVQNLQALTKTDAIYAIALAQQANTPSSMVRVQCWQAILNVLPLPPSGIATLGTVVGGSGYDSGGSGVFPGIPLSGGSGTGAIATVTVVNGVVTEVALTNPGVHYAVGDVLTGAGSIGGSGSGFSVPVVALMATPAEPHLITNVEEIAELVDGLQPTSPLFVNCAGAAQLAQLSVLSFVNAIVTGAAGIATIAPKL